MAFRRGERERVAALPELSKIVRGEREGDATLPED
jgi:hypothetical protein